MAERAAIDFSKPSAVNPTLSEVALALGISRDAVIECCKRLGLRPRDGRLTRTDAWLLSKS